MVSLIEQHSGEISDQISDGMVIILENPTQLVKQITQLVKRHSVTSQQFRSLSVLTEKWLRSCVESNEIQDMSVAD